MDENSFTEVAFKRCLEFLYTGYVDLNKDSLELDQTILAARLMNLPELQMICENARLEQEFLNPSIGTWLNDRNSSIAKTLFLNQQLMSDIKFRVEGEVVYGHKVVLSARCEVLGAMLTGGFAESNSAEVIINNYYNIIHIQWILFNKDTFIIRTLHGIPKSSFSVLTYL